MPFVQLLHCGLYMYVTIFMWYASADNGILKLDCVGLAQDCSNSIANALELLQSCTKASIWL